MERYQPASVPKGPAHLQPLLFHMETEFRRIAHMLEILADGEIEESHVAPDKPRTGMIRLADGTNWNPGAGQGIYIYYAAAWHKMG